TNMIEEGSPDCADNIYYARNNPINLNDVTLNFIDVKVKVNVNKM
ncbi:14719_t:CDS:1, partial [Entrophospora sp. SA101]